MTPAEQELHRRATEARAWLLDGYSTKAKVDELMLRIADKRGQLAADQLREDMRVQWSQRSTWPASVVDALQQLRHAHAEADGDTP